VAADSLLVVAVDVVQAPNDKRQIEPTLKQIDALPDALGEAKTLLANTGYFSAANVRRSDWLVSGQEMLWTFSGKQHYRPFAVNSMCYGG
jgi:hypothetical protein